MLARAVITLLLALPVLTATAANVVERDQCDSGNIQCCQSLQTPSSLDASNLLGLLGISVSSITGLVGLNCTPVSVIGLSANSCPTQLACCANNSFNGLIALGCVPIQVTL